MRKRKKLEIKAYDKETGEFVEGVPVWCGVKKNPYNTGWVMNSQKALEAIAIDKEITGRIHRVLWLLIANLDFENWIQIPQKEICEKLNMKKPDVSSAIKILEKKEIILRGPKLGRSYSFRLNPDFAWKGDVKYLDQYREKKEKERTEDLKDKVQQEKDPNLRILSQRYNIPLNKIEKFLTENTKT